jgi:hypothetical protein
MRRAPALAVLLSSLIWNPHVRAESEAVPSSRPVGDSDGAVRLPEQTTARNTGSPRWGWVAGGLALFTVGWAPLCAGTRDERCIPIVGAGIVVHRLWTEKDSNPNDGIVPPRFVAMAASTLVLLQVAGAALTVVGFAVPKREPRVAVSPWLGPDLAGLSARGRF